MVMVVMMVMVMVVTPVPPVMMVVVVMIIVLRQFHSWQWIGSQAQIALSPLGFQPRDRIGYWIEELRIGLSSGQRPRGGGAGCGCAKRQGRGGADEADDGFVQGGLLRFA